MIVGLAVQMNRRNMNPLNASGLPPTSLAANSPVSFVSTIEQTRRENGVTLGVLICV
jgi:hypothetical protein